MGYYNHIYLSIYELTLDLADSYTSREGRIQYIRMLVSCMVKNNYLSESITREDIVKEVTDFYTRYEKLMMEGPLPASSRKLSNGNNVFATLKAHFIR